MAKKHDVYKCNVCGHIIEVLHDGAGDLVCCGENMELKGENTTDAAQEKHVPVVEKLDQGIKAKVGDVAHPMQDDHYIEWIQVITPDGGSNRHFLKPGDAPEADFRCEEGSVTVREYCNLHGLWKS